MRNLLLAGFALVAASAMSGTATAAPASVPGVTAGSGVILVEGGCGPRGFRAANGRCYARRPRREFRRRACPPRYHLTPYGCRLNYR